MATLIDDPVAGVTRAPRPRTINADRADRLLAAGALVLLGAVTVALARGLAEWHAVPGTIWAHVLTILIALVLTPIMLLRRRGDRRHRMLGAIWLIAMFATAALSFNIRVIAHGQLSLIHLLSAWTMIQVPVIWWTARSHKVTAHRRAVRGMVIGALLVAGFFTFPFDRLMGHWLFG